MADKHELLESTVVRLEKFARPFETVDELVNRILDTCESALDASSSDDIVTDGDVKDFEWQSPPDLTHTKVLSVEFNTMKFPRADTTWNSLLNEAVRLACQKVESQDELKQLILTNYVVGKKEDEGYRYLDDVGVSVQGQDANAAWKGVARIARRFRLPFDVVFTWRVKKGSSHPGITGRFAYSGKFPVRPLVRRT
jgi:hypothetical protein